VQSRVSRRKVTVCLPGAGVAAGVWRQQRNQIIKAFVAKSGAAQGRVQSSVSEWPAASEPSLPKKSTVGGGAYDDDDDEDDDDDDDDDDDSDSDSDDDGRRSSRKSRSGVTTTETVAAAQRVIAEVTQGRVATEWMMAETRRREAQMLRPVTLETVRALRTLMRVVQHALAALKRIRVKLMYGEFAIANLLRKADELDVDDAVKATAGGGGGGGGGGGKGVRSKKGDALNIARANHRRLNDFVRGLLKTGGEVTHIFKSVCCGLRTPMFKHSDLHYVRMDALQSTGIAGVDRVLMSKHVRLAIDTCREDLGLLMLDVTDFAAKCGVTAAPGFNFNIGLARSLVHLRRLCESDLHRLLMNPHTLQLRVVKGR
jgi:hypothetical protein